jgi:tetratricopeptide (TPR) repeat protein
MRLRASSLLATLVIAVLPASLEARADESPVAPAPNAKPEAQDAPQPQTPAELRADLYQRLAASSDADETDGLVGLLFAAYGQSGSDAGDLLLERARKAMGEKEFDAAGKILDSTIALLPDWAEGWNARATLRYLDDDYDGSMADVAETLKREPRHLGALMGMSHILEARDKKEEALKVCERVLAIAPHWRNAEKTADRLKSAIADEEL